MAGLSSTRRPEAQSLSGASHRVLDIANQTRPPAPPMLGSGSELGSGPRVSPIVGRDHRHGRRRHLLKGPEPRLETSEIFVTAKGAAADHADYGAKRIGVRVETAQRHVLALAALRARHGKQFAVHAGPFLLALA